tara:strand:- start:659 stop:880 length:222 start_codon:yes stop_codon:yes gene_type:complete
MLIHNKKKPTDYTKSDKKAAKAVMTQDRLLKLAVANDANIAKARQEVRLGVPPTELLKQYTPEIRWKMSKTDN